MARTAIFEEAKQVKIAEARKFLGKNCAVTYLDSRGDAVRKSLHVHDVQFVPLYGAYLIGDTEDVSLDRITSIDPLDS